jgi:formiminotetrahydrofolate cyclodeaminase
MDERLSDLTVRRMIERLATSDPVPGGGSAAALAGAMAAALVHMVVELTAGRPAGEGHEPALAEIGPVAAERQSELLELAELDASAYAAVVRTRRLPRATDDEREARGVELAVAVREATRIPLVTAQAASGVLDLAERLAPIGNRNAVSDVGVAALLAVASVRGAVLNVEINLPSIAADDELRREASDAIVSLLATLDDRERAVHSVVAERLR